MSVTARDITRETPDEDLVAAYQAGEPGAMETLLERYRDFARLKARSYFLAGADRDDIVQEGMIGLYKAIRDYRADGDAAFRTFAEVCITRQILTAVKTASRHKHGPLNTYVSLATPVSETEGEDRTLADVIPAPAMTDPAEMLLSHENVLAIRMAFSELLSEFETEVLHLYVEGKSYEDIAGRLGRSAKAVDNALQRIKRKLELHTQDHEPERADLT
ncbi:MAG TPA: RNA polymerase sporulation sigma factor SigH [Actinomycetota bacterium]|nr:RNA polymerase sporulation sigma factor SigH [Actinomycetota bacterium]